MTESESCKIRIFHGVEWSNKPIYTYDEITLEEYEKIYESVEIRNISKKIEQAYEFIVFNYRDYELNNFTIILNDVLSAFDYASIYAARSGIDRHVSNILASTYLYTSLLRIKRKNSKINDFSFENSDELSPIFEVKAKFQNTTNHHHREHYQYTFVSALRNRINHGGDLDKTTELGGSWSMRYEPLGSDTDEVKHSKDKRYSLFDQKILKSEAKNTIRNQAHYSAVESTIPEMFYLRETMRRYIDLLSSAHSEVRVLINSKLNIAEGIIYSHLDKQEPHKTASLIKYAGTEAIKVTELGDCGSQLDNKKVLPAAPLNLEHYIMPGEPSAIPQQENA